MYRVSGERDPVQAPQFPTASDDELLDDALADDENKLLLDDLLNELLELETQHGEHSRLRENPRRESVATARFGTQHVGTSGTSNPESRRE